MTICLWYLHHGMVRATSLLQPRKPSVGNPLLLVAWYFRCIPLLRWSVCTILMHCRTFSDWIWIYWEVQFFQEPQAPLHRRDFHQWPIRRTSNNWFHQFEVLWGHGMFFWLLQLPINCSQLWWKFCLSLQPPQSGISQHWRLSLLSCKAHRSPLCQNYRCQKVRKLLIAFLS